RHGTGRLGRTGPDRLRRRSVPTAPTLIWRSASRPPGQRRRLAPLLPPVSVPAIIISPYAKRRFVDHTAYETTSILKFIEACWRLAPLGSRDAAANNLFNAFDFSQTP